MKMRMGMEKGIEKKQKVGNESKQKIKKMGREMKRGMTEGKE